MWVSIILRYFIFAKTFYHYYDLVLFFLEEIFGVTKMKIVTFCDRQVKCFSIDAEFLST